MSEAHAIAVVGRRGEGGGFRTNNMKLDDEVRTGTMGSSGV